MFQSDVNATGTIKALRGLMFAALIIPAFMFAAAAWWDRTTILQNAQADAIKLIAVFQGQAEALFKGHKIILDLVVSRLRNQDWDKIQLTPGLLNELETIDNMLDDTSAIVVVDSDGKTRATTLHTADNEPMPSGDTSCFHSLRRSDFETTCVSNPYLDPVTGQHLFSFTRRLEKDGQFSGMAQVAISADYIMNLWAAALPRTSDAIAILRPDGTILAEPNGQISSGLSPGGASVPFDKAEHAASAASQRISVSSDHITIIRSIGDYPAYISLVLDRHAILTNWYDDLIVYAIVAIGTTTGIVLALGLALRRARTESRAVARWQEEARERERAQNQLIQSQKMESLGKLTGGVAHDFNNLLTVIVGNLGLIGRFVENPTAKRQLRNALQAGESAVALTQRLLAFARKRDLQLQPVNMMNLVEGMRGLLLRTLGDDIRLVIEPDSKVWPTLVDTNQMELVILNIAINARDAMPAGGTFSITLTNRKGDKDLPQNLSKGDYVVMTVTDTGTGMDAATLARATEPFFTTKGDTKGTGLGLSMMEGVVAQSGGATRLRSELGVGTAVEIWLPRTIALPEVTVPRDLMQTPERGDDTVLLCDDNPAVLEFLSDVLVNGGYKVIGAQNGQAALLAVQSDPSIQMLVVDYAMPEMNGAQVISQVKVLRPKLPILIVTGNADPDAVQDELPDVAILTKPFTHEQLVARVGALLERTPVDILNE